MVHIENLSVRAAYHKLMRESYDREYLPGTSGPTWFEAEEPQRKGKSFIRTDQGKEREEER